jgi:hypothetical protein
MSLEPDTAPGTASRKARAYEHDIARLRALGYTLDAIREALAKAGVVVSISTVWREASRARRALQPAAHPATPRPASGATCDREPASHAAALSPAAPSLAPTQPESVSTRRSGKDIAEEFRRRQNTNPLMRAKEHKP